MTSPADNSAQRDFWSDEAGPVWVHEMRAMDALLENVLHGTLARAQLGSGQHVLDVGCGAGTSTLRAAQAVGPAGSVLGVDISDTLLAAAQARAPDTPNVRFLNADAQHHRFDQRFDVILSRFGVMFFADPVAAFRNMAEALQPAGRMTFAAWGQIGDNPFFTLPAQVSKSVLGPVPRTDPDAPGPFAFRDAGKIVAAFADAGLQAQADIRTEILTPQGSLRETAQTMCAIGPAERALSHFEASDDAREALIDALVPALEVYDTQAGLRIPAQINYFTVRKSS